MPRNALSRDSMTLMEKTMAISWPFLFLVTVAASVGFMSLYSAAGGNWDPWAGKQLARFCLGLSVLIVAALIDIRVWMRMAYPIFGIVVLPRLLRLTALSWWLVLRGSKMSSRKI